MAGSWVTVAAGGLVIAASLGASVPTIAAPTSITRDECRDGGGKVTKGSPDGTLGLVPAADDCQGGRNDGEPVSH
jgi:hypothetical protein